MDADNYFPVLIQFVIAAGFAGVTLLISVLLGQRAKRNAMKDSAYECGMLPVGDGQPRFSVKFYLVAMLFVLFDIEVVFLYPWAVSFNNLMAEGGHEFFWGMVSFLGILFVAYLYALKKGALQWKS
jgi:NADH-quinone oxidoreductase subunit A